MKIKQITFSPTGGTRKVADNITLGIEHEVEALERCNPAAMLTETELTREDVAIIAMPCMVVASLH